MLSPINLYRFGVFLLLTLLLAFTNVSAQKKTTKTSNSDPVLWKSVNIKQQNLFSGPGGEKMRPDINRISLIEEEKGGHSKKFKIKDAQGKTWVAKAGDESQSETAAVRLIWALGYKTEINYLVPKLMIPGKGVFSNVRLEARPDNVKRTEKWNWGKNPFVKTNEFQGLKIMMAFLNNWDLKTDNNIILKNKDDDEIQYVISDLGVSFGKLGSSQLPIFWRIGRSRNNPLDYNKAKKFVTGVKKDRLKIYYHGKSPEIFDDITVENGRWLANLLLQLSDKQIADAFRAANYSSTDINLLTQTVKKRIAELDRVTSQRFAGK